jgi:shikimate kinase
MRIFLIGFMGSGKTHWGRLLAKRLQLPYYDLDEEIESREGRTISQIFASNGEEYFRVLERDILENVINDHTSLVISCGGGTPCFFNNIDMMKRYGVVVWLNSSIDALYERLVREKNKRPLLKNISNEELKSYILKKMNDRRLYYEQADITVEEEQVNLDSLIQTILHA